MRKFIVIYQTPFTGEWNLATRELATKRHAIKMLNKYSTKYNCKIIQVIGELQEL